MRIWVSVPAWRPVGTGLPGGRRANEDVAFDVVTQSYMVPLLGRVGTNIVAAVIVASVPEAADPWPHESSGRAAARRFVAEMPSVTAFDRRRDFESSVAALVRNWPLLPSYRWLRRIMPSCAVRS
jgi:hypothetical protein